MLLAMVPWDALAQPPVSTLPAIEVHAPASAEGRAAERIQDAREELARRAGATSVVDAKNFRDGRAATVVDVLAYAPGILAQTRHGQESRLSIRGSGIQRGFLMRGVQLYQDGIPINHTDGTADFQSIDPMTTQFVEVWRGANALEYGANGLGGAINFVSPTGLTAPTAELRAQSGSFGQRQFHANLGGHGETIDGFLSVSRSEQDGWRENSAYRSQRFSSNIGMMLSDTVELRGFLSHADSKMQMPGSLSRAAMQADPRQAAPRYWAQKAANDFRQTRGAVRLGWQPSADVSWVSSFHTTRRDRFHAMTLGILQQEMKDSGFDSRLAIEFGSPTATRRLVTGFSVAQLSGEEKRYINTEGAPGSTTGRNRLKARQDNVYAEYTHGLTQHWNLQAGLQIVRASRQLENRRNAAESYDIEFTGSSPKLGVLYAISPSSQWFANISKSFEAPPFGELVFHTDRPLARAQSATTLEGGWRGTTAKWDWDVAVYRSQVSRELLSLTDVSGAAVGTINADRTIHQGLELSFTGQIAPEWTLRGHYLYNDFRFDGDAIYGNRRLAGIPTHVIRAELQWQVTPWLKVSPSLDWQPSPTWVDHANTVRADGFSLLNLRLNGELSSEWSWFIEGRNLTNRTYAATTAVQADARGLDGNFYFPGDGRAFYMGLSWRLP
ncbi:MAG: TonB-dependent receptor family protein [Alcaligenes nematophilus]|uniref:TonB-dependent receptor family protein n=1 Tax=Alcaligenes nematophilus TaxID=2994643 RepID=UPI003D061F78